MGKKTITMSLNADSVRDAIQEIREYQRELNDKTLLLCQKLADIGVTVGRQNTGDYSYFITWHTEIEQMDGVVDVVIMAENEGMLVREFLRADGTVATADVNPLLMAEFGSGWRADNKRGKKFGAGQGTFPSDTAPINAFKPGGWHWRTPDGKWHTSKGEEPTMPMLNAYNAMLTSIKNKVKEVFG